MARGWESKAVAEQMEEEKQAPVERPPEVDRSPEARLRREQLERLRLSCSRTLAQLELAASPKYRQILENALQALEKEIEELSRPR